MSIKKYTPFVFSAIHPIITPESVPANIASGTEVPNFTLCVTELIATMYPATPEKKSCPNDINPRLRFKNDMLKAVTPSQSARVPPLETQKSGSGVINGKMIARINTVAYMMRFLVIVSFPRFLVGETPK